MSDHAPVLSPSTPASEHRVQITGISAELGLVDVALLTADALQSAQVILLPSGDSPRTQHAIATMLEVPRPAAADATSPARWVARIKTNTPRFQVRIEWHAADRTRGSTPAIDVSANPDAGERTPDWAKGAVWYQIFVDRFRNGAAATDPRSRATSVRPWNEPWHSLTTDEVEHAWAFAGDAVAAGSLDAIGHRPATALARQARRYGGDLPGIAEKLPDLQALGIDALYLTPIFDARSSHKYDATDFRHIDPTLGPSSLAAPHNPPTGESLDPATWTLTPADRYFFDEFVPAIHARGMRIILDGVWNHVGKEFWAFRDLAHRGSTSPFASWFDAVFATGDPDRDGGRREPGSLIGWRGWNRRNGELPVFARRIGTDGDTNFVVPVREHLFHITRRWMNPAGPRASRIDGWRLDVAPDVPRAFWGEWHAMVKTIDPDALLIGEVWFPAGAYFTARSNHGQSAPTAAGSASAPPFAGSTPANPAHGRAFDGQMNYPLGIAITRFISGDPTMPAPELSRSIRMVLCNHPATDLVQLNLLGSHDTARLATMMHDPSSGYEELRAGHNAPPRPDRHARPSVEAYQRVILGVALQATLPGSPMIYSGDEVGVFGANDPDCRKPFPWPDLGPYPPDRAGEPSLLPQFRAWLALRHDPATRDTLRLGGLHLEESGNLDVIAFRRSLNTRQVLVIVNRGNLAFDAASLRLAPDGLRPAAAPNGLAQWNRLPLPTGPGAAVAPNPADVTAPDFHAVPPTSAAVWWRDLP